MDTGCATTAFAPSVFTAIKNACPPFLLVKVVLVSEEGIMQNICEGRVSECDVQLLHKPVEFLQFHTYHP